ncbi:pentapeptide repeat-containing protein [Gammaproteobacteria bacterium]|nr:pentapeptide repeat-containing protein [Gammaproteobacteria bacterium]
MKKLLPLILSTLLLTSCSGPDSSGGVVFSKTANAFPYGDCRGSGYQTHSTAETGCGWITVDEKSYYIMPDADLNWADLSGDVSQRADLSYANLTRADLSRADLSYAYLAGANLDSANLSWANLTGANLSGASLINPNLSGVLVNSSTICPNGKHWGTSGNDCGF